MTQPPFEKPSVDIPAIEEMAGVNNWVCWKSAKRGGKVTKLPYHPLTGKSASTTDPATWSSFDDCVASVEKDKTGKKFDGVGFVFSEADPYCGIDLDHCIVDGKLNDWAKDIVKRFNSYTEYSPSGDGLHIFIKTKQNLEKGRKRDIIECYTQARFFTFTGKLFDKALCVVREKTAILNEVMRENFKGFSDDQTTDKVDISGLALDPSVSISKDKFDALGENCAVFRKTWEHKRKDFKDTSLSSYDLALANQAFSANWSDEEVYALLVSHRRKATANESTPEFQKILRPDYIQRTFEMAKRSAAKKVRDVDMLNNVGVRTALTASDEDILTELSSRLGCNIEGVIKRGLDPSMYYLLVDGRECCLGRTEDMMRFQYVQARILEVGNIVLNGMKNHEWHQIVALLIRVQEFEDTGDPVTFLIDCVVSYLDRANTYADSEWRDAYRHSAPYYLDGKIWVNVDRLFKHNEIHKFLKVTRRDFCNLLRQSGFKHVNKTVRLGGDRYNRKYWGIDPDHLHGDAGKEE